MSDTRKVALITGAARRIGAAIARRLHADGYNLSLHYRQSAGDMDALLADLNGIRAGSAIGLHADLSQFERLPELVTRTVDHFGRLDALVNNASSFFPTPVGTATQAQWDDLFASNARAPFFLAQAAAPHLRAAQGGIVNLAGQRAARQGSCRTSSATGAHAVATNGHAGRGCCRRRLAVARCRLHHRPDFAPRWWASLGLRPVALVQRDAATLHTVLGMRAPQLRK